MYTQCTHNKLENQKYGHSDWGGLGRQWKPAYNAWNFIEEQETDYICARLTSMYNVAADRVARSLSG